MSLPAPARDLVLLLARVGLGVVFVAHGWQKLFTNGIDGTAAFFSKAGVPVPTVSAWYAALVELVGGIALIAGLGVLFAGVLLAVDMLGAFVFVHVGNGVFAEQNGYELVVALGVASLLVAAFGAGRLSLDHALLGRRTSAARTPAPVRV